MAKRTDPSALRATTCGPLPRPDPVAIIGNGCAERGQCPNRPAFTVAPLVTFTVLMTDVVAAKFAGDTSRTVYDPSALIAKENVPSPRVRICGSPTSGVALLFISTYANTLDCPGSAGSRFPSLS